MTSRAPGVASATALRWMAAVLLVVQMTLGFVFHAMDRGPVRTDWFTWHKSVGLLILLLSLAYLGGRLYRRTASSVRVTRWTERLFMVLVVALPLTGLLAVSAYTGTTRIALVGGWSIPQMPGIAVALGDHAEVWHKFLVQLLVLLLAFHIGAAILRRVGPARWR